MEENNDTKKIQKKYRKNPNRSVNSKYTNKQKTKNSKEKDIEILIKNIEKEQRQLETKITKNFKMSSILILLIAFLTGFTLVFINYPFIEINGKKEITLEYNTEYIDEGAKAVKTFSNISNKLIVFNEVDTTKIGTYSVSYIYPYLGLEIKKKRTVKVVDTQKPMITLQGKEETIICPNKKYEEEGYQATDDYEGDITDKVNITELNNEIVYKIKDSSGNKNEIHRKIIKSDKENPKLELIGNKNIYLTKGKTYKESGYKATDNCDGDITDKVEINNQININKTGSYIIEYKITDSSGNTTKETRTVKVIDSITNNAPPNNYSSTTNQKGVIYLTFDDGPSNSITPKLLDILKEENVKATFFVISNCNNFNKLVKREYDEGHTVALHSYTHDYSTVYKSIDNYFNDLNKIRNKVYNVTGEYSNIIRFPGGSSNTISKRFSQGIMSALSIEVNQKGYHYFDWNISSGDAGEVKSSKEVYNNVTKNLNPNKNNIVLMHDFENNNYTLNAIRDIIKYGKNNGYTFAKITMSTPEIHHNITN